MRRITVGLVSVVLILGLVGTAGAFSGSGSGTVSDPYIITNVDELQEMQSGLWAWYELGSDIDASDTVNWHDGDGFVPVGDSSFPFSGHLDGSDFAITGLFISRSSTDRVGLFGKLDEATVKNVCLANVDIEGKYYTGGLVGYSYDSIVAYCDCAGSVVGTDNVGGLVGYADHNCEIGYCHSAASVVGTGNVGGLVGYAVNSCEIAYCHSAASVVGTEDVGGLVGEAWSNCEIAYCHSAASVVGTDDVGGLVGYNFDADITDCHSAANVTGTKDVGGLVGYNYGEIAYCHSAASVVGTKNVGGLVGYNYNYGEIAYCHSAASVDGESSIGGLVGYNSSTITESFSSATVIGSVDAAGSLVGYNQAYVDNCFATGSVSGGNLVGGLIGHNSSGGTITDSYSAAIVSGTSNVGGFVGYNTGTCNQCFWDIETSGQPLSACGTGKSTEEMKTEVTFDAAGWNFVTVWNIQSWTYPCLKEVGPIGDLNHDCHVDFQDFALMASHWLESTPGI